MRRVFHGPKETLINWGSVHGVHAVHGKSKAGRNSGLSGDIPRVPLRRSAVDDLPIRARPGLHGHHGPMPGFVGFLSVHGNVAAWTVWTKARFYWVSKCRWRRHLPLPIRGVGPLPAPALAISSAGRGVFRTIRGILPVLAFRSNEFF